AGVIPVRFNPWRFENETDLLSGYFNTVAAALNKQLKRRSEKLAHAVREYGSVLLVGLGKWGDAATKLANTISDVSLFELKHRIEFLLEQEQRRVVVLMDDIDRLDKNEIHSIFKLIKLTADFSHTAYVLAFDEIMVARVLGERYGSSD